MMLEASSSDSTKANPHSHEEDNTIKPCYDYTLAASTGDIYNGSIIETNARERRTRIDADAFRDSSTDLINGTIGNLKANKKIRTHWENEEESNCFRSVQWTGDGKYLVTNSEDSAVRVFELPLDWATDEISQLKPYSVVYAPESVYSIGVCPWALEDPTMNWFITCTRDNPLHLYSLDGSLLSSYILQHKSTEKYLAPHSIVFSHTSGNFICGTESMITVFDLHCREPLYSLRTIPTRNSTSTTQTMKGVISSMDISSDRGILAAGTFTRSVGLYDQEGSGDVIAIFSLGGGAGMSESSIGSGVTDVKWSSCGTYLYVAERKATTITVWDMRRLFSKVATLTGREAMTVQRLGFDILMGGGNGADTVIGGGLDGKVRIWDPDVDVEQITEWTAHKDPVTSVAVNPAWPGLIATCSGQRNHSRKRASECDDAVPEIDNSVKVWKYTGPYGSTAFEEQNEGATMHTTAQNDNVESGAGDDVTIQLEV